MNTLYLECAMGAAGDMLTGALCELLPDPEEFIKELNGLGIPGVKFSEEKSTKCGIDGTHISVEIYGEEESEQMHAHHHHSGMQDVERIVSVLNIPQPVRQDVLAVYRLIAEAESHAHGTEVDQIHFHEVGTLDAIADVTAVCLLMYRLQAEKIVASPVHVGTGTVHCAHGILPVPAPATAWILRNVPVYGGSIQGELCTPTGAALLKHFVSEFGPMPLMRIQKIGYGMGKKDFSQANCVRAMLGQTEEQTESILELSCNVDDMTGEAVGFAAEQLLSQGALDVYTEAVGMKKSRPGIKICVMCREADRENMISLLFHHTTTLGVRECRYTRYMLTRTLRKLDTPWGTVRQKESAGWGVSREKYEYEDLAAIAREKGWSLYQVVEKL